MAIKKINDYTASESKELQAKSETVIFSKVLLLILQLDTPGSPAVIAQPKYIPGDYFFIFLRSDSEISPSETRIL